MVVFSFGADDAHDYMGGAHVGPFGSPSWVAEYRRRVDGVTRELNAAGIYVVWLGLPIPDGPGFRKSFPVVNRILEGVAHAHAQARDLRRHVAPCSTTSTAATRAYLRVHGKLTLIRALRRRALHGGRRRPGRRAGPRRSSARGTGCAA